MLETHHGFNKRSLEALIWSESLDGLGWRIHCKSKNKFASLSNHMI